MLCGTVHFTELWYCMPLALVPVTWLSGNAELARPASWKIKRTAIKIRSGFKTLTKDLWINGRNTQNWPWPVQVIAHYFTVYSDPIFYFWKFMNWPFLHGHFTFCNIMEWSVHILRSPCFNVERKDAISFHGIPQCSSFSLKA